MPGDIRISGLIIFIILFVVAGCETTTTITTIQDKLPDGRNAPEMVIVPAGTNTLGDISRKGIRIERPTYQVTIAKPFAIAKYEVTFQEYDYFAKQTGRKIPDNKDWGRGRRPVIGVTWYDAKAYVKWLSKETREEYFLPSEAQWEYAARAGTQTNYWWGDKPGDKLAQCGNCAEIQRCDDCKDVPDFVEGSAEVGSFKPNPFGLYDTLANVAEWTADCGNNSNSPKPSSGSPRLKGDCSSHIMKGGTWASKVRFIRAAVRVNPPDGNEYEGKQVGFRIARRIR